MNSGGKIMLAFLGGAAVGAAVGLLSAPASGEELRTRIRTTARERRDQVARLPQAVRAAYSDAAEAARSAFVDAYNAQSAGKAIGQPPASK